VPFFFFNDTATTEIYTLSLHDALPISLSLSTDWEILTVLMDDADTSRLTARSEEPTSELQSRPHLVCRLLLEKKKNERRTDTPNTGATSWHESGETRSVS